MATFIPIVIVGISSAVFGTGTLISILKPKEEINYQLQVHYILAHDNDKSLPANSFRLVIVNQKKSWNKAVRAYCKGNNEWDEVKCGDTTGKEARVNSNIKFDSRIVTFDGTHDIKIECWRPSAFGIWSVIQTVKINAENVKDYIGNTVYMYFDNDEDRYFLNDANKLSYEQLA